ncbi:MAG TPA: hypothetical protein VFV19_16920 [Candidatus Polarisedimenticolaceae bacterium]|nr:hypothetical protein [Candidatus Polarisedimenticolaceae bacterium]
MDAPALLRANADDIVEQSVDAVLGSKLTRYTASGRDVLRCRLSALLDVLARGIEAHDAAPTIARACSIAAERYADGFELQEVQCAINILEATVWQVLARELPVERFADAIRAMSSILGLAKDALARSYVELAAGHHAPAVDTAALFRGTDGV